MNFLEKRAAITGIGMSSVGRLTHRPAVSHLVEAFKEALDDAGLDRDDIDGLTTYPGKADKSPGMSPLGCLDAREALGLKTRWHSSVPEGAAQMAPIMVAAMAVATGQARHVMVFRALTESSSQTAGKRASIASGADTRVDNWFSWLIPMGAFSAANWSAMFATRYMHEFGVTREDIGTQCVLQRENAAKNSRALLKDKPLQIEEYLDARMISDPLCLYDCDIPIDGACVIIVSAIDAARELRKPPLRIEAMSAALTGRESWDQRADLTTMASHDAAAELWNHTDFTPEDLDVAAVYDGFSIFVPLWLEAFGVCPHGEGARFIRDGQTRLNGKLPTNTGGGQLSAGRLHGFGHLHEACIQLWGEGEGRQVPNAKLAACGMGGGFLAGAMLIARED